MHAYGPQGAPHGILSAWHADSTPAVIVRGDTMYVNVGLNWVRLPIGTNGQVLMSSGLDPVWSSYFMRSINLDEADAVDQSRTAETNMKTYNLPANPYQFIVTEGEFKLDFTAPALGVNATHTFRLYYGAALIKTWTVHHRFPVLANLELAFGFVFKSSAAAVAGGLIRFTQQNNLGADTPAIVITEHSLRVYGVV